MATARVIRRRDDDDGRRTQLIVAATRTVARDGVAAATTRRIAAEAGLPLGAVHYWFSGKDDLFAAVVEKALSDIESAATAQQSMTPDLRRALHAAWGVVVDDEPGRQLSLYEMTTAALRSPEMSDLARRQYAAYRAVAAEVVRAWYERS